MNIPSLLRPPSPAAVIAVLALVVALAGVGYAAIPGPDGTIKACQGQRGTLRVIDSAAACESGETPISWSQTGPQGPVGPAGAPGTTKLLNFTNQGPIAVPRTMRSLGTLDLPAGHSLVTVDGTVDLRGERTARGFSWGAVDCSLNFTDEVAHTSAGGHGLLLPAVKTAKAKAAAFDAFRPVQHAPLSMSLVVDAPAGGERGTLSCGAGAHGGQATLQGLHLTAMPTDQISSLNFTRTP